MVRLLPRAIVLTYDELHKYSHIDQLFPKVPYFVLLYQHSLSSGHWVGVFRVNSDILYFFDSYGYKPDTKQFPKSLAIRNQLYSNKDYLTDLIFNSGYKELKYNTYRFQENNTYTCGYYVVVRLRNRNLSGKAFYEELKKLKGNDSFDELIIKLI
jgi:hypothetical protein